MKCKITLILSNLAFVLVEKLISWVSEWFPTKQHLSSHLKVEVLREFRKRFCRRGQHSSNRLSGISTSPQLHPCHRLFDQDGHQDSSSHSYSPDLAPCDFWLFLSSQAVVIRQLRRWKRLWRRSLTTLTQEDFHGAFQKLLEQCNKCIAAERLLWRELEFHVYTINKSAHTKKVWKLI